MYLHLEGYCITKLYPTINISSHKHCWNVGKVAEAVSIVAELYIQGTSTFYLRQNMYLPFCGFLTIRCTYSIRRHSVFCEACITFCRGLKCVQCI